MATKHGEPIDFFSAIDDPEYFHGRRALLDLCRQSPWRVRVVLGGRRIGKTSFLKQFQHEVAKNTGVTRVFGAYWNVGFNVPSGKLDLLNRMLSQLAAAIQPPIDRSWFKPDPVRSVEEFQTRLEGAIRALRVQGFHGVCFAMDECDPLFGQDWWTEEASAVLRFESERLKNRLSFIFTGFRELRDQRQNIGSRLMEVAEQNWLSPLESSEVGALVRKRCGKKRATDRELAEIEAQAGGHPMLTQRLVSAWLDIRSNSRGPSIRDLADNLRVSLDQVFEDWWGRDGASGGFTEPERMVYTALLSLKEGEASILDLADRTSQTVSDCRKCLHALCGSGIVIATSPRTYRLGARMFADWVGDRGTSLEARIGPSTRPPDAPSSDLQAKIESGRFDVFLCHNSKDKPEVKVIANQLKERGLLPWLDEWELRPGVPWQRTLEEQITKVKSAAVFIGGSGIGPWQDMEQTAFIRQFMKRNCPVIPVFLPEAPKDLALPTFLEGQMSVDFRRLAPDPLNQLIWGITGRRQGPRKSGSK
jgi:hypothetical protein